MSQPSRVCRPRRRDLACAFLAAALCATSTSLVAEEAAKPARLFDSEQTMAVTLTGPWRTIERDTSYQGSYPARIQYVDELGAATTLEMTVERRGIKRQQVCRFPPIKLRFDKESVKGTTFRGQKSLKLVTHCDKSSRFDQYVVLEFLAYRMYNLLTPLSFRVRPLQVTYIDSDNGKEYDTRFAFLIEDDSDVAKRNEVEKFDTGRLPVSRLDPRQTALMSLYEFMIGNVDWAATAGPDPGECCHNVKLMAPDPSNENGPILPVPYDFDSAGLINANYALPPDGLPISSVTQRLYRGYCLQNAELDEARAKIRAQRAAIEALVADEDRLTKSSKSRAGRYLEGYFDIDADSGKFARYVIERCRK